MVCRLLYGQTSSALILRKEMQWYRERWENKRGGNTEFNILRNIHSKNLNITSYGISKVQIKTWYHCGRNPVHSHTKCCKDMRKKELSGSGDSPGEGNGNPLQCSWLENPMDRGTWQATVNSWNHNSQTWQHCLPFSFIAAGSRESTTTMEDS